jgi:hypothetical protein
MCRLTGQRNPRLAVPRQKRTEHQDRCAHGLDQLVGRHGFRQARAVDFDAHALGNRHADTHAAQQFDHRRDVVQVRNIADRQWRIGQQSRGKDWQCRILGTRRAHVAREPDTTRDLQLFHGRPQPAARRAHSSGAGVSSDNA